MSHKLHKRYHDAQADPKRDTAAKRLARAAGLVSVACGCGEVFSVAKEVPHG